MPLYFYYGFPLSVPDATTASAGLMSAADKVKLNALMVGQSQVVPFSATPTFDPSLGEAIFITLTGNITSWTLLAGTPAQRITIYFEQTTGGNTLGGQPGNVLTEGSFVLSSDNSQVSALSLQYDVPTATWFEYARSLSQQLYSDMFDGPLHQDLGGAATTSNATPLVITNYVPPVTGGAGDNNKLDLLELDVSAVDSTGAKFAIWKLVVMLIKIVFLPQTPVPASYPDVVAPVWTFTNPANPIAASGWGALPTIDVVAFGGGWDIRVIGVAATIINWRVVGRVTRVRS
jgi:hypothetical protein